MVHPELVRLLEQLEELDCARRTDPYVYSDVAVLKLWVYFRVLGISAFAAMHLHLQERPEVLSLAGLTSPPLPPLQSHPCGGTATAGPDDPATHRPGAARPHGGRCRRQPDARPGQGVAPKADGEGGVAPVWQRGRGGQGARAAARAGGSAMDYTRCCWLTPSPGPWPSPYFRPIVRKPPSGTINSYPTCPRPPTCCWGAGAMTTNKPPGSVKAKAAPSSSRCPEG